MLTVKFNIGNCSSSSFRIEYIIKYEKNVSDLKAFCLKIVLTNKNTQTISYYAYLNLSKNKK